jgi:hypothetical protein
VRSTPCPPLLPPPLLFAAHRASSHSLTIYFKTGKAYRTSCTTFGANSHRWPGGAAAHLAALGWDTEPPGRSLECVVDAQTAAFRVAGSGHYQDDFQRASASLDRSCFSRSAAIARDAVPFLGKRNYQTLACPHHNMTIWGL